MQNEKELLSKPPTVFLIAAELTRSQCQLSSKYLVTLSRGKSGVGYREVYCVFHKTSPRFPTPVS